MNSMETRAYTLIDWTFRNWHAKGHDARKHHVGRGLRHLMTVPSAGDNDEGPSGGGGPASGGGGTSGVRGVRGDPIEAGSTVTLGDASFRSDAHGGVSVAALLTRCRYCDGVAPSAPSQIAVSSAPSAACSRTK